MTICNSAAESAVANIDTDTTQPTAFVPAQRLEPPYMWIFPVFYLV